MKRLICVLLLCALLCSCAAGLGHWKEPVTFYYLRSDYREALSSIVAPETREAEGFREDLSYLLALYLIGPSQKDLVSPIPKGTNIHSVEQKDGAVTLWLSDTEHTMTESQFSLACACLALTCFDITDAHAVTIYSASRVHTMTRENLIIEDSLTAVTEETQ